MCRGEERTENVKNRNWTVDSVYSIMWFFSIASAPLVNKTDKERAKSITSDFFSFS